MLYLILVRMTGWMALYTRIGRLFACWLAEASGEASLGQET